MDYKNLIRLADQAFKNNKLDDSIKLLQNALQIEPNSFDINAKLGILNLKQGNLEKSKNYFNKTIELNPKSLLSYLNLGIIYVKLNNRNLALKNYLKALKIDPKNFGINYNLGNYYFANNDLVKAEKYYLISINLDPKNFYPYNNLFQLYDRSNNIKKLDFIINKILDIFPRTSSVQFLEGIYEFRKKNYEKTIRILNDLNISKQDAQRNALKENTLGKCYDFIGSYSDAFKHFSKSNDIIESFLKDRLDRNRYVNFIKKKINFIYNNNLEADKKTYSHDKFNDPVFLIGFPRSGTTLLDTILRTHKRIKVIEEKNLVDQLINKLNKIHNDDYLKLETLTLEIKSECRNLYFESRKKLLGYDDNAIYIDKMPLNILYVVELKKIFPRAKFILALRNPFDVVLSCFMQPFQPNDAMSNFFNLRDTSEFYDLVMELWKKYEDNLNLDLHIVKYENVVGDFESTIKNLIKFLNVDWSEDLKYFYLTARKRGIINTPSYNQVNMPLYKESISRWKNYRDKFSEVNSKLDKWVKIFGY